MSSNLPYRSRAVRAMVLLHEEHLRRFVHTWRLALATSVSLPPTDDPAYASLGALGRHVLGVAGGYMVWMWNRPFPHPRQQHARQRRWASSDRARKRPSSRHAEGGRRPAWDACR